jgi:hypothetical protein
VGFWYAACSRSSTHNDVGFELQNFSPRNQNQKELQVLRACAPLPPIVRIVLTQATRHRMRGQISLARFQAQVQRLSREELATRGLALKAQSSPRGRKRWVIEVAKSGKVLETIEISAEPGFFKDQKVGVRGRTGVTATKEAA